MPGSSPDPGFGDIVPAIHQASTYVQPAPGEFVEDYDYSRSANPTRSALEHGARRAGGRARRAFASGMAADHALITAVCQAGRTSCIPDDLYGGTYRLVDKVLARWGLAYTMVDQADLDAVERAVRDEHEADLGRDADQPDPERGRIEAIVARKGTRSWRSTTRSPRRSTSARWSWARTPSCTRRRSTSAGTPTRSAAR